MPIKSYIAIAHESMKSALEAELKAFPQCELVPSENKDVLVLVTDTANEKEDSDLLVKLHALKSLKHLNLVSAFNE